MLALIDAGPSPSADGPGAARASGRMSGEREAPVGDCQGNGVTGLAGLLCGWEEASFEGDGEGVEGGLPAVHPALAAFAGGVEAADDQVEALERGLLVGEVPPGLGRPAHPGVQ